jgi:arsenate reductase (thioredoxin)
MVEKLRILFVCVENVGRSQMAEAFARSLASDRIDAYSAGSKPGKEINLIVVAAMKEKGIDISGNRPKGFSDLRMKEFDYMVTMGCGDACPIYPSKNHIDWKIEDPKGMPIGIVRKIRDDIEKKVKSLIDSVAARGV